MILIKTTLSKLLHENMKFNTIDLASKQTNNFTAAHKQGSFLFRPFTVSWIKVKDWDD